jgi:hypothetical protein
VVVEDEVVADDEVEVDDPEELLSEVELVEEPVLVGLVLVEVDDDPVSLLSASRAEPNEPAERLSVL